MKEVIILGGGFTKYECPYDKEVWSINGLYHGKDFVPDMVIQLHKPNSGKDSDLAFMKSLRSKFLVQAPIDGIDCVVYPLDEIISHFNTKYFASSTCFVLAYAIYEKYEKIWLYGIDHTTGTCYVMQKACVEYWIGRATERGIEVVIPKGSALCKTMNGKLYGYDFKYDMNSKIPEQVMFNHANL